MDRTCVGAGMTTLDIVHNGSGRPDVYAGGSCTNVLTILSWLGWRAVNVARLGADPEGKSVIADMSMWGVVTDHISMEKGIETPRIIENLNPDGKHSFSLRCRHGPTKIDNPVASGAAGQVHAVDPRFQDISVGPAVRISG